MSVLNMPVRVLPDVDLEQATHVAVALSRRLASVRHDDLGKAISDALRDIADTAYASTCALIEFTDDGRVACTHLPVAAEPPTSPPAQNPASEPWLVERLLRGDVVAIGSPEELPHDPVAFGNGARRAAACSILGVPASVSGQVVAALVLSRERLAQRWPAALIERVQLLAEIFAAALTRDRQENALRTNVAMIESLNARLNADNVYLKEEIKSYHDFDDIAGESASLQVALKRVAQVAPTNSTVLLQGQTGTGKELFARALHEHSRRHARPLVRVNCAALPPTLVESELFGHEKGAFTGAVSMRQGRFELADGGTIFLDEIGDLTPEVQVKFLRVLQEGEFERVGSSRTRKVDVRVIAATHQNLEAAVADGRFRADLYYRLSVYPIHLPSLRERWEDIPRLVWFFIHRHQRELGRHISKVPQSVMETLQSYDWPGNVRELENVVERAMIGSTGDTLLLDAPLAFSRRPAAQADVPDNLDAVQRAHIEAVLERSGWKINGKGNAAERLGLHPNTLRFRMKKLGVVCPEDRRRRRQAD